MFTIKELPRLALFVIGSCCGIYDADSSKKEKKKKNLEADEVAVTGEYPGSAEALLS